MSAGLGLKALIRSPFTLLCSSASNPPAKDIRVLEQSENVRHALQASRGLCAASGVQLLSCSESRFCIEVTVGKGSLLHAIPACNKMGDSACGKTPGIFGEVRVTPRG